MKQKERGPAQVLAFCLVLVFFSCSARNKITPPVTSPLSRSVIGYGVVMVSYTSVTDEPNPAGGVSLGILRMGTVVEVLERRFRGSGESWVLVEGDYHGWLREDVLDIFENEAQAKTAADLLLKQGPL